MSDTTDAARELVSTLEKLKINTNEAGHTLLSKKFGTSAWSRDYYRIIFCILDRIQLVEAHVAELDMYDDEKAKALAQCEKIKPAFSEQALRSPWNSFGLKHLTDERLTALQMLSPQIRVQSAFTAPTEEELRTIVSDASQLREWLEKHELHERDFIRKALIQGLDEFLFRASKFSWVGQGYCVKSLREVITAYMALERGEIDPAQQPDIQAVLQKAGPFIKSAYTKLSMVRGVADTTDWLLRAYCAASAVYIPVVAGLLTSQ